MIFIMMVAILLNFNLLSNQYNREIIFNVDKLNNYIEKEENIDRETLLYHLIEKNFELFKYIIENYNWRFENYKKHFFIIDKLIEENKIEILKFYKKTSKNRLLDRYYQNSIFLDIIFFNKKEIFKLFLTYLTKPNYIVGSGDTFFHILCKNMDNPFPFIKYFVKKGGDLNLKNDRGVTPFMNCISNKNITLEWVKWMVKNIKGDIVKKSKNGSTLLIFLNDKKGGGFNYIKNRSEISSYLELIMK